MARIRSIKPEFPQSETIGELSRDARLLFIQIWTIVDDSGRARAASRMLASLLYPYDNDAPKLIDGWLEELEHTGCIRRYMVDGSRYLDITNWLKHQKIDKPSASKLPEFVENSANPREPSRTLATDLGPRTKDLGEDTSSLRSDVARERKREFESEFWPAYPHKVGKPVALKAFTKARTKDDLETIMDGLRAYVRTKPPDRNYCNPATWLNEERWNDQPSEITDKRENGHQSIRRALAEISEGYDDPGGGPLDTAAGNDTRSVAGGPESNIIDIVPPVLRTIVG